MVEEFHVRRIAADADLYGVAGNPVLHSLSPAMHNAGFAALGLNAAYLPLEAASVEDFVTFARAMGLRGRSITAPFKVDMLAYVDELDPLAEAGRCDEHARQRVDERAGRWRGANTDVEGFLAPLTAESGSKGHAPPSSAPAAPRGRWPSRSRGRARRSP
jgi:3-dehydroquinate dehydratase / shikimate dehydrogenase